MTEATTYSAFTPKFAPFEIMRIDKKDIEIKPIDFLFSKKSPNSPRLYISFRY